MGKRIDKEFVIICSNVQNPGTVLKSYRRRWCVETCFKEMKSQGFRLENTHMTDLERLRKLMALVAVGILVSNLSGMGQKCAFKKTVRAPLYSLFTKGLRFLKQVLWEFDFTDYLSQLLPFIKSEG